MSGEDVVNLDFFPELLPLEFTGFWDLHHDARMDLIDERDASSPDPVHIGKLVLDTHAKKKMFSKRNILKCAQAKLGCVYKRDERREEGKRINLIQTKVD